MIRYTFKYVPPYHTRSHKMKSILRYALISIWFTMLCSASQSKNIKSDQIQASQLLQSIQRDLKDPRYRQDILPNNFSYLVQLFGYGVQTKQTREFAQDTIGLFSKVLKGSEYLNSYVFNSFLEQMPDLLKHYFVGYQLESTSQLILANDLDILERLQQTVTTVVYTKFTNDFASCKTDPEQFLNDLSQKIVDATKQEISMEQLRQIIIRFLEVCISKLIWNPKDQEKTWESLKSISHNLATLMEYNIIDDLNDMDELFWSLLHRYRYFLELNNSSMPLSFYAKIRNDIRTKKLMLFELEEQEPFLQSKASCLMHTVLTQEAKKRAYDYTPAAATA